jgi:hypothetical protein
MNDQKRERAAGTSAPACSVSDSQRIDWMEDSPERAMEVMREHCDAKWNTHMLRQRIDEAMKPNK